MTSASGQPGEKRRSHAGNLPRNRAFRPVGPVARLRCRGCSPPPPESPACAALPIAWPHGPGGIHRPVQPRCAGTGLPTCVTPRGMARRARRRPWRRHPARARAGSREQTGSLEPRQCGAHRGGQVAERSCAGWDDTRLLHEMTPYLYKQLVSANHRPHKTARHGREPHRAAMVVPKVGYLLRLALTNANNIT